MKFAAALLIVFLVASHGLAQDATVPSDPKTIAATKLVYLGGTTCTRKRSIVA